MACMRGEDPRPATTAVQTIRPVGASSDRPRCTSLGDSLASKTWISPAPLRRCGWSSGSPSWSWWPRRCSWISGSPKGGRSRPPPRRWPSVRSLFSALRGRSSPGTCWHRHGRLGDLAARDRRPLGRTGVRVLHRVRGDACAFSPRCSSGRHAGAGRSPRWWSSPLRRSRCGPVRRRSERSSRRRCSCSSAPRWPPSSTSTYARTNGG